MSKGKFEAPKGKPAVRQTGSGQAPNRQSAPNQTPARQSASNQTPVSQGNGNLKINMAKPQAADNRYATVRKPAARSVYDDDPKKGAVKLWPILAAVAGVVVLIIGIVLLTSKGKKNPPAGTEQLAGTTVADQTTVSSDTEPATETVPPEYAETSREGLEARANLVSEILEQTDLVLTIKPQRTQAGARPTNTSMVLEPEQPMPGATDPNAPVLVILAPELSGAHMDLEQLKADLDAGKGQKAPDVNEYELDLRDYLVLDEEALRSFAEQTARDNSTEFEQTSMELVTEPGEGDAPDTQVLVIHMGVSGRSIAAADILEALHTSYLNAVYSISPEEELEPQLTFTEEQPEAPNVNALFEQYHKEPKNAELDPETQEVTPEVPGVSFDKEAALRAVRAAQEGEEVRIVLEEIPAEITAESLGDVLFKDVLAEAHTNHTNISARTNNLKLACQAIDGTVVLPGEVFSFNDTVGERTEEKGYREAIAYVSGGASKPEVGGGVCQVASSIYYAVLQADLKTVERAPHMYLVEYVPGGMDAAIYWGSLDYKFENNSPYPIKIEASVSGGQVHIVLLGTEWKDYTVKMTYEVLETFPYEEKIVDVPDDGTYREGEVIATPYTGYSIASYKTTYNADGEKINTVRVAVSNYHKRDKTIAHIVAGAPNPTEPTEPSYAPTQPPTQPTTPPTQPTEPPTQPTEPPTQPTEPPTQPTEPPTQPTEPPTQPTEPPTQPTEPPTQPTEPPTQPTEPPTQPAEPPTQPTEPPTEPTEPPAPSTEEGFEG